jgi:hypothetical protein
MWLRAQRARVCERSEWVLRAQRAGVCVCARHPPLNSFSDVDVSLNFFSDVDPSLNSFSDVDPSINCFSNVDPALNSFLDVDEAHASLDLSTQIRTTKFGCTRAPAPETELGPG